MDIEQWARPTDPPARHPAGAFGKRAELAGWRVEYRAARGPVTTRRRPAEPDERGKYALIEVTTAEDTLGLRAVHPDGRRIAAWWIGTTFDEAWVASPRANARQLGIRALTKYLTEIEEETVSERIDCESCTCHPDAPRCVPQEPDRGLVERDAEEAWLANQESAWQEGDAYVAGYVQGHAAATDQAGDAYGEGYAAGLAAAVNRPRVWVPTRRRLDALRPGDVILGKGDRWWVVTDAATVDRDTRVRATSEQGEIEVLGVPARLVVVVEPVATADALAALKAEGIEPERAA